EPSVGPLDPQEHGEDGEGQDDRTGDERRRPPFLRDGDERPIGCGRRARLRWARGGLDAHPAILTVSPPPQKMSDRNRFSTTMVTIEVRSEEHTSELQSRVDLVCR